MAYLKNAQAAAILGLAPGTLSNLRSRGKGPRYIKISPRLVRYTREDIDAWMKAHMHEGSAAQRASR